MLRQILSDNFPKHFEQSDLDEIVLTSVTFWYSILELHNKAQKRVSIALSRPTLFLKISKKVFTVQRISTLIVKIPEKSFLFYFQHFFYILIWSKTIILPWKGNWTFF